MEESATNDPTIVVGVDGSEASVEALRQAQRLAVRLGAKVLATAYWDDPQVYAGYVATGIDRFDERLLTILSEAIEQAFGQDTPPNVIPRVIRGHPGTHSSTPAAMPT